VGLLRFAPPVARPSCQPRGRPPRRPTVRWAAVGKGGEGARPLEITALTDEGRAPCAALVVLPVRGLGGRVTAVRHLVGVAWGALPAFGTSRWGTLPCGMLPPLAPAPAAGTGGSCLTTGGARYFGSTATAVSGNCQPRTSYSQAGTSRAPDCASYRSARPRR